jgi:hypothetical protein
VTWQTFSTSRTPFGERLGTQILRLTVCRSGKLKIKCTQAIKEGQVSYFKEQFLLCGSNPNKFCKTVKDTKNKPSSSQLPIQNHVDDVVVTGAYGDMEHMAKLFNHHFIKSGFLFDSAMPPCPSNIS